MLRTVSLSGSAAGALGSTRDFIGEQAVCLGAGGVQAQFGAVVTQRLLHGPHGLSRLAEVGLALEADAADPPSANRPRTKVSRTRSPGCREARTFAVSLVGLGILDRAPLDPDRSQIVAGVNSRLRMTVRTLENHGQDGWCWSLRPVVRNLTTLVEGSSPS